MNCPLIRFQGKVTLDDNMEVGLQMSIRTAAFLRHKQELVKFAPIKSASAPLIESALTILGHEHNLYGVFPCEHVVSEKGGVHALR